MTTITFDLSDEIGAAGYDVSDGQLVLRYAYDFTDGDTLVTAKPFGVDIVNGVGTADVHPTPPGNGLIVRVPLGSGPHGVRRRVVEVPDSPTPVNFTDLVELDEDTMAPPELANPIAEGFAALQGQLNNLPNLFVRFVDMDGEPLTAGTVVIRVNPDAGHEIDDIFWEA